MVILVFLLIYFTAEEYDHPECGQEHYYLRSQDRECNKLSSKRKEMTQLSAGFSHVRSCALV